MVDTVTNEPTPAATSPALTSRVNEVNCDRRLAGTGSKSMLTPSAPRSRTMVTISVTSLARFAGVFRSVERAV
jgi:hypothetical protein